MNWINQMFEAQLQWYYDSALVYITGRDVVCAIWGFTLCIVVTYFCEMIEAIIEERKQEK